jgi:hypothetical protein
VAPKVKSLREYPDSEEALDEAFYRTFNSFDGKQVYELLESVYHSVSSFESDTHMMAYKEGQRSIFLQIKTRMDNYLNRDVRKKK